MCLQCAAGAAPAVITGLVALRGWRLVREGRGAKRGAAEQTSTDAAESPTSASASASSAPSE